MEVDDALIPESLRGQRLVRTGEAAQLAKANRRTLLSWSQAGIIDAVKLPNGYWLYGEEQLKRMANIPTTNTEHVTLLVAARYLGMTQTTLLERLHAAGVPVNTVAGVSSLSVANLRHFWARHSSSS